MKTVVKIVLIGILVVGLIYLGACVYANISMLNTNPHDVPDPDDAIYTVKITNTGARYYSNSVDDAGGVVTMHGYWQLDGDEYEYTEADSPPLDRDTFGTITVRVRR